MTHSVFTPTTEHLQLFAMLPLAAKFSLRLLAKSMKFRDLVDYLIEDCTHPDEDKCIMAAEIAYYLLDDNLEIKLSSSVKLVYSQN